MEINAQNNTQQNSSSVNSTVATPVNDQESKAKEIDLKSEQTVNVSTAAEKLSTETEKSTVKNPISTKQQAVNAVSQFEKDAANDANSTKSIQGDSITHDVVASLIS